MIMLKLTLATYNRYPRLASNIIIILLQQYLNQNFIDSKEWVKYPTKPKVVMVFQAYLNDSTIFHL